MVEKVGCKSSFKTNRLLSISPLLLLTSQLNENRFMMYTEPKLAFLTKKSWEVLHIPSLYLSKRNIGSAKCNNKQCKMCNNIEIPSTHICKAAGDTQKINHHLYNSTMRLVYLMCYCI